MPGGNRVSLRVKPIPRYIGLVIVIAMTGFAAVGFFAIRRDVAGLQSISRDGILWSSTQMEVELLRFHVALAELAERRSQPALAQVREQFNELWSRVLMMSEGNVGAAVRRYEDEHHTLAAMATYLEELDEVLARLTPDDRATVGIILRRVEQFEQDMRLYTLRVVRADSDASAALRARIQQSAQTTALLSLAAVILSMLSLFLILRENRRQRDLVALSRRVAEEAEQSSRGKLRFLTMMSHELRNPLNGILGPLALLEQSGLGDRQRRLVEQVRQCGQTMLQMLMGLLDYAEIQDGLLQVRHDPFRITALAGAIRDAVASGGAQIPVVVAEGGPERIEGDLERLSQVFVNLVQFVLDLREPEGVQLDLSHTSETLTGVVGFQVRSTAVDWKLDLLVGMTELPADQVTSEALRPLVARTLIGACLGSLSLDDGPEGRRLIVVRVPAPALQAERIRVHLETRSSALAAIYQATLRSDRIDFSDGDEASPVDVVLVDSTSVDEEPMMEKLRSRFPRALFVSLGHPQYPAYFDDVVASPRDMTGLRRSILSRLAS